MGIRFICAKCQRPLNVDIQLAGQRGQCPNCAARLEVPESSDISEEEFRQRLISWRSRESGKSVPDSPTRQATQNEPAASVPDSVVSQADPPEFVDSNKITESPVVLTESQKITGELLATLLPHDCDILNEESLDLWYVRPASGGQFGPADNTLLKTWISEGRVAHDSYVWCEGWTDWRLAKEVFISRGSPMSPSGGHDVPQTEAVIRPREAYLKARKKRTMRALIGLGTGVVVVLVLILVLIYVVQNRGG